MVLSSEKNLYEILEVSSTANATIIKSAYRKLARKYHPDLNSGDKFCVKKFKQITEAYEILSDADKKKNYDILRGFYQEKSQAKRNEANRAYNNTYYNTLKESNHKEPDQEKSNQKESKFSNVFNDILEGFKNTTSSKNNQTFKTKQTYPEKGRDVYTDVKITMIEAMQGTTRTVNVLHTEQCPKCEGRTFVNGVKCSFCSGLGEKSTHKKLAVKIPAYVKHGSKIRIANEGNKGYNGGKNGDLYLNIRIEADSDLNLNSMNSKFKYDGLNVLYTIPIAPFEAIFGASIDIKTPKGKVLMKVLPNTHSGQKFRLSAQGLEKNGKIGDMIVTVNIETPQNLSAKEIELYKELRNITKNDIRENNDK